MIAVWSSSDATEYNFHLNQWDFCLLLIKKKKVPCDMLDVVCFVRDLILGGVFSGLFHN